MLQFPDIEADENVEKLCVKHAFANLASWSVFGGWVTVKVEFPLGLVISESFAVHYEHIYESVAQTFPLSSCLSGVSLYTHRLHAPHAKKNNAKRRRIALKVEPFNTTKWSLF